MQKWSHFSLKPKKTKKETRKKKGKRKPHLIIVFLPCSTTPPSCTGNAGSAPFSFFLTRRGKCCTTPVGTSTFTNISLLLVPSSSPPQSCNTSWTRVCNYYSVLAKLDNKLCVPMLFTCTLESWKPRVAYSSLEKYALQGKLQPINHSTSSYMPRLTNKWNQYPENMLYRSNCILP